MTANVQCDNNMPCSRCLAEERPCTFDGGPSALLSSVTSQPSEAQTARKRKPRRKSSRSPSRSPDRTDKKRKQGKKEETFMPNGELQIICLSGDAEVIALSPLGSTYTSHWFSSGEGVMRFAGSTSGMPVLSVVLTFSVQSALTTQERMLGSFFSRARLLHHHKRPMNQLGTTSVACCTVIWLEVR